MGGYKRILRNIAVAFFAIAIDSSAGTTFKFSPSGGKLQNWIGKAVFTEAVSEPVMVQNAGIAHISYTYYDGLGRPLQTVGLGEAPNGADLADFMKWNVSGIVSEKWSVAPGNGKGEFTDYEDLQINSARFYSDNAAYTDFHYDNTVLGRLVEEIGAGSQWKRHNGIEMLYSRNVPSPLSENGCYWLTISGDGDLQKAAQTPAGLYSVKKSTDEDGYCNLTFTDVFGKVVLTRRIADGDFLDTYYVYDARGNLRYVLPPLASAGLGSQIGIISINDDAVSAYGYTYLYDDLNRCVGKRLPGTDWILTVYDQSDRPVLTQNGNQRVRKEWTLRQYDVLGRSVFENTVRLEDSRESLAAEYDRIITPTFRGGGTMFGFVHTDSHAADSSVKRVNYYDDYCFLNYVPDGAGKDLEFTERQGYSMRYTSGCCPERGLLTGDVSVVGNGKKLFHAVYYDDKGRIVQEKSMNHLGGVDCKYYLLGFDGRVKKCLYEHTNGDVCVSQLLDYTYDHAGRLLTTKCILDGGSETMLEENEYDGVGRLSRVVFNGGACQTAYDYNVRGWITRIINPYFNQLIAYNAPLYNGNVSSITTRTPIGFLTDAERNTTFVYDGAGRLAEASYQESTARTNAVDRPIIYSNQPDFSAYYSYDRNGNLSAVKRLGAVSAIPLDGEEDASRQWCYGMIDNLKIERDGNRLLRVDDSGENPSFGGVFHFPDGADGDAEYTYDANGNMISDKNKGIRKIKYNDLNHPECITFDNGVFSLTHLYDSRGRKLRTAYELVMDKIDSLEHWSAFAVPPISINKPVLGKETFSRDYCGNVIYKDGKIERILTPCGYALPCKDGGYEYYFYIHDFQGNVSAVVNESSLIEQTGYYPYGMPITDVNSGSVQPYKFGGKELDCTKGIDLYDFDTRQLDSSVPGFTTIDPLCEATPDISPYAYCAGNPVRYIDPTGMLIYVSGIFYTTGMEYSGSDPFAKRIIEGLNRVAINGGEKLLGELQKSDNEYNYIPSGGERMFTSPQECIFSESYGGADIYISTLFSEAETDLSIIHEAMHGAQYEAGQGGRYYINEIEAYAFECYVGNLLYDKTKVLQYMSTNLLSMATGAENIVYDSSFSKYMYDRDLSNVGWLEKQMNDNFPTTIAYQSGKYFNYKKSYPPSRTKSLYKYYMSK